MKSVRAGCAGALSALLMGLSACAQTEEARYEPLPLDGFADAIHHRQMGGDDGYVQYDPAQIVEIADNMLLLQRDNGGWDKNQDPIKVYSADERAALIADKATDLATFDNRNIYTQVEYLLGAYERTGEARFREGALRGLDYLLDQQIAGCGGWPHTVPAQTAYQDKITFNDDVMSGILFMLRDAGSGKFPFGSLDAARVERIRQAEAAALECVLRLQVRQGDRLTAWAGQYDPVTLQPVKARSYELASIASAESVPIVEYLMGIEAPSEEVIAAVDGAVAWLREVAVEGVRVETFDLPQTAEYEYHRTKKDRRLVEDPDAPLLWARYYDLQDNSHMLANRDGVRVERYDQIDPERRSGYSWYGNWAAELLKKDYPAWVCRVKGC